LDKWRVFYNDKKTGNVYIILDGYLPNTLIPEVTGISTTGTYQAYWNTTNFSTNEDAVATLKNTVYWRAFASGVTGATAYGGVTNEMFVNSWNENPAVNETTIFVNKFATDLKDSSKLYIPYNEPVEGCYGYWLASSHVETSSTIWFVNHEGVKRNYYVYSEVFGMRPLICLPSGMTGEVGATVSIYK